MNKYEIAEIKKIIQKEDHILTRIAGCYVDAEKEKRTTFSHPFFSLSEEETNRYLDILRKSMSGTLAKNLISMDFPLEEERKENGPAKRLQNMRSSKLEDEELLQFFYDDVIESYPNDSNYLILLVHGAYDVPVINTDGTKNDTSDEIYDFILCSLCPLKLTKPALYYNKIDNQIEDSPRDWVVQAPLNGFLYPAFNNRSTDIHSLLFYTKNASEEEIDFCKELLACDMPITYKEQKETFQTILEDSLGESCDTDTVKHIHVELNEMVEQNKENPEPLTLGVPEFTHLLSEAGVENEHIEKAKESFEEHVGSHKSLAATNIASLRKFEVTTPDVKIQVNPDRSDLVETKVIDGIPCIVIECNDTVEINGIRVANPGFHRDEEGSDTP